MFTGIIEAIGKLYKRLNLKGDVRITIRAGKLDLADIKLGDSVAINGVCLTVVEIEGDQLSFDVSTETLQCTSLGLLAEGAAVNLEKALLASSRLGGHIVSGHVDGLAKLVAKKTDARSVRFEFEVPEELSRYIAAKGSICIDGVSLTVNEVAGNRFAVCIIPHTMEETVFQYYQFDQQVNIEVDMLARYVERLQHVG